MGDNPMEEKKAKRKLTAILSADVKGYSHLMQDDEEATVRTITAYREVMTNLIQGHDGRVVDAKGDNVLAEFPSVVDAVRCGVEIQKELKVRNDGLPENRKMAFRIGINLGDVIEEGDTIYGDGVNIAARLEGLAEGGGICISGTAFDHIGKKLPIGYEYLGEQTVKNIEKPVRAYNVLMGSKYAGKVIGEERPKPKQWRWAAVAIGFVIVVGALAIWNFYFRPPPIEPASEEKMAFPLPDKASIAVLPFTNMSGDPEQEYIVDGITENIITALAKAPRLFVIARNSTFTYKGKAVKVKQVAEELGVRYVLEGSIQWSGDRIRVTAQLIDALSGRHLWSERYDRDLTGVLALQDEIALRILSAMQVKLTEGEQVRWRGGPPQNAETVLKYWEATRQVLKFTKESNAICKRLAGEMITEDPDSPLGYDIMAQALFMEPWFGSTTNPKESLEKAVEMAQKGIALDAGRGHAHSVLAYIYSMRREYEKAIAEGKLAVQLEPSGADCIVYYGIVLSHACRAEEAIPYLEKGLRLNPYPPIYYYVNAGHAHTFCGQYEKALTYYKEAKRRGSPNSLFYTQNLTVAYALLGRQDEARANADEMMRLQPDFSLEWYDKILPFCTAYREIFLGALRKAGLK